MLGVLAVSARYLGAALGVAASITAASSLLPAGQSAGFSAHGADAVLVLGALLALVGTGITARRPFTTRSPRRS